MIKHTRLNCVLIFIPAETPESRWKSIFASFEVERGSFFPDKIQLIGIKFSRSVILQGTFTPRKPIDSSVKEPPSHVRKIIDATSKIGLMKKILGKIAKFLMRFCQSILIKGQI